jgi:hypothetical protein
MCVRELYCKDLYNVADGERVAGFGLNTEFVHDEMVVTACVTSKYFVSEIFLGE